MLGYREPEKLSSIVPHDQKGNQALKAQGRNKAKVDRLDCVGMVAQECPPRLRWRSSVFDHVLGAGDSATSKPSLRSSPWMRRRTDPRQPGRRRRVEHASTAARRYR